MKKETKRLLQIAAGVLLLAGIGALIAWVVLRKRNDEQDQGWLCDKKTGLPLFPDLLGSKPQEGKAVDPCDVLCRDAKDKDACQIKCRSCATSCVSPAVECATLLDDCTPGNGADQAGTVPCEPAFMACMVTKLDQAMGCLENCAQKNGYSFKGKVKSCPLPSDK